MGGISEGRKWGRNAPMNLIRNQLFFIWNRRMFKGEWEWGTLGDYKQVNEVVGEKE
jgi:hypothetical protein